MIDVTLLQLYPRPHSTQCLDGTQYRVQKLTRGEKFQTPLGMEPQLFGPSNQILVTTTTELPGCCTYFRAAYTTSSVFLNHSKHSDISHCHAGSKVSILALFNNASNCYKVM
jgi:hypothetical protein